MGILKKILKKVFRKHSSWKKLGSMNEQDNPSFPEKVPKWIRKKIKKGKIHMPANPNKKLIYEFKGKKYKYKIKSSIYSGSTGTAHAKYSIYRKKRHSK